MANELIIRIGAESKQFQEELDKISSQTEDLENQLSSLAKISGVAFAALVAEAGFAIKAFAESEEASNRLTQALQNQGIFSEELAESYKKQAKELQELTGIDDDAIIKSQSLLQSLIGQQAITPDLTAAIVDLSAAKQMDLDTTAELIGKGINGQTAALKKLGIEIDENLTKEERTAQIIERVTQAYGGNAEAAASGVNGIKKLNSAFSDLQEEIGSRLAPAFNFIVQKVTAFVTAISANKPLLDLITSLGVAAAVVTGLVTALSLGAIALAQLRAAMIALGIATNASKIAVQGLVGATGIGLLVIIASELYLNWSSIWPRMQAIFVAFANNISALAGSLGKILLGILNPRTGLSQIKEGYAELKNALSKGLTDYETTLTTSQKKQQKDAADHEEKQNASQKRAADKRAREQRQHEADEVAARKAHLDLLSAQSDDASTVLIETQKKEADLRKQLVATTGAEERAAIQEQIEETVRFKELAQEDEKTRREVFQEELLAQNEEFQALDDEQKQIFLEQHQSQLMGQMETEASVRRDAALKRSQEQIKSNNQFLVDQQKFGTAYALINKAMHNEIFLGSKTAFGELAQLTQSSNSTLKSIGKVAAVANIIIKTAESAMNIYAGFSQIPIVGPALGVAGAAAAVAFGGEQIARVTSAADGGLITGGIAGKDSVPSLLMPGELVVPQRNFSDVVNAVAARQRRDEGVGGGSAIAGVEGLVGVTISLEGDETEKVITARQTEAKALGTFRGT